MVLNKWPVCEVTDGCSGHPKSCTVLCVCLSLYVFFCLCMFVCLLMCFSLSFSVTDLCWTEDRGQLPSQLALNTFCQVIILDGNSEPV